MRDSLFTGSLYLAEIQSQTGLNYEFCAQIKLLIK